MKKIKIVTYFIVSIFFLIGIIRLYFIVYLNHDTYKEILVEKTDITIKGLSAPRGRILDRNGNVLVDNKGIETIMYNKIKGISIKEELNIANSLASILEIELASIEELKDYWLLLNDNGKSLITAEEYRLYEERKISNSEIKKMKEERITLEMLESFSDLEKEIAHIYALMNEGLIYEKKILLENVSEEECAKVVESNIPGITVEMSWIRVYPYGDVMRSILGSIGSIQKEEKEEYLSLGYELTDIVGTSYLEKEYEEYLQGTKAIYKVNSDYTLEMISSAKKGQDLVLGIDIDIQKKVEEVLKEKIILAKDYDNTEYFKESYALVSDPNNGEIIAMAGMRLNDDQTFSEVASNNINTSYTIGSTVKGATIAVGYKYNLVTPGSYITDSCVKLYLVPQKCSHKRLGRINDLDALAQSSNYFQYKIAINLTGNDYHYNMKLNATEEHFKIYRDVLNNFGLGSLTEIDLPGEVKGIEGVAVADDLLLNLAIGQYDTYTPVEVLQYINSVASGNRYQLSLKNIDEGNVLNTVDLENDYLERIRLGMNKVLLEGTGKNYVDSLLNPVGKTGTSESFYDSNSDGTLDLATISSAFAGYFPKEDPKYSVVVISPNVSHKSGKNDYMFMVAKRITRDITDFLFENY